MARSLPRSRVVLGRARRWVLFSLVAAATLASSFAASVARAEDPRVWPWDSPPEAPPGPVRVELLGGTTAPVGLSLGARIVALDRLLVGLSLGMTTYGGAFGNVASAYGGPGTAPLISTLADGAFTLQASFGLRPFEGEGLELVGGYTLLHQSVPRFDALTLSSALDAQTGADVSAAEIAVHAFHVELAWTFVVLEHFLVRPALGYLQAVRAEVSLDGSSLEDTERALAEAITRYGMAPSFSLALGYRF